MQELILRAYFPDLKTLSAIDEQLIGLTTKMKWTGGRYSVCEIRFKSFASRNQSFLEEEGQEEIHIWIFKNYSFTPFWTNERFLKIENGLLPQEMPDFWRKKF